MMKRNKEHIALLCIRIILGLVFIFSSMVKGFDPMGTSYRVQDYLLAYGWESLIPYAMHISLLVILSEFLLGIAFLFRLFMKTASRAMFLMLAFFTVVTLLDGIYNWVPDCGCFGDAVKLTNWETFYKNVILILLNFVLMLAWTRKYSRTKFTPQFLVLLLAALGFSGFMAYNINHLPLLDFRDWKTGRDMKPSGLDKEKTYVIYQNRQTGEQKEFLFPNYPWKDTAWMTRWKFVTQRIDDSKVIRKHHLVIEDSLGNNLNHNIIENPDNQFLLIAFDLNQSNRKGMAKAIKLYRFLQKRNISMVLLTASDYSTVRRIEKELSTDIPAYLADDIELKAMIRSNPGLIWLKNGYVIKKWHYHDFPTSPEIKKYLSPENK